MSWDELSLLLSWSAVLNHLQYTMLYLQYAFIHNFRIQSFHGVHPQVTLSSMCTLSLPHADPAPQRIS